MPTSDLLDSIREKQKSLDRTTHKLLDKALPSTEMPEKKRKSESQGKQSGKKTQNQSIGGKQAICVKSLDVCFIFHLRTFKIFSVSNIIYTELLFKEVLDIILF